MAKNIQTSIGPGPAPMKKAPVVRAQRVNFAKPLPFAGGGSVDDKFHDGGKQRGAGAATKGFTFTRNG